MELPKEIKIATRTVKVEIKPLDGLFGQFDPMESVITLNKSNTPSQMIETFWHELIHAINDYNRVAVEIASEIEASKQDDSNADMRSFMLEERMTENFASVFLQVITDNNLLKLTA